MLITSFNSKEFNPLLALRASSAFGARLCFYKTYPIEPSLIPVRTECRFYTDATPQEQSEVKEVKQACAALRDVLQVSPPIIYPVRTSYGPDDRDGSLEKAEHKCKHYAAHTRWVI